MLIVPARSYSTVRDLTENDVTSTVFAPLHFMSSQNAWNALRCTGLIDKYAKVFNATPRSHSILFWQYFSNPDTSKKAEWDRCEPDAVFCFDFGDSGRFWLVLEVKWNAAQSSYDEQGNGTQLARQWVAIRNEGQSENAEVRQAYLTLSRSSAEAGIEDTKNAQVPRQSYIVVSSKGMR
jgi:hypothetical protein